MARGAGAALHGKAHRLVEHQHVGVFVERNRADEGAVLLRLRRVVARWRRVQLERRNAHGLAAFEPRLRLGALAVHAHLALADDALDMAERQAGIARLEKAVDAHAILVAGHRDRLHAGGKMHRLRCGDWRRCHRSRFARRTWGKGRARTAAFGRALASALHLQIGLAGIVSFSGALFVALVAIKATTTAARACSLPSAARLARAFAAAAHDATAVNRASVVSSPSRSASLILNRSPSASRNSPAESVRFSEAPLRRCTESTLLESA